MPFPKKILTFPIGWKDLGKVDGNYKRDLDSTTYKACGVCLKRCHVGKENDGVFTFCPRCLIKVTFDD